ncbi:hypothetical protein H072_7768 [Dactylellina haptotyla CBS 200.50]|uniref:DUF3074 domain-containing protein n=1 Tax=Dactylellina haptotyla (strain CBS 200.50) TaxID=1284197 RepID=S8ABJ1_DACHA|nr:hypothetical protein H072_7768 [Dactylellina haptotyla CBS 200.50]
MRLQTANTLTAVLTASLLPSADAFWIRYLWKNPPNGEEVYTHFDQFIPDARKVSDALQYRTNTPECGSLTALGVTTNGKGPTDPSPGIITIINSPELGIDLDYIFYYEDENCQGDPTLMLQLKVPKEKSDGGYIYVFDFMDQWFPELKAWRRPTLNNLKDRNIMSLFKPSPAGWDNPDVEDAGIVIVDLPEQGGMRRWKSTVSVMGIPLKSIQGAPKDKIAKFMARALRGAYGDWLEREKAYITEQENLNTDFGSEGFNFIPNFHTLDNRISEDMKTMARQRFEDNYLEEQRLAALQEAQQKSQEPLPSTEEITTVQDTRMLIEDSPEMNIEPESQVELQPQIELESQEEPEPQVQPEIAGEPTIEKPILAPFWGPGRAGYQQVGPQQLPDYLAKTMSYQNYMRSKSPNTSPLLQRMPRIYNPSLYSGLNAPVDLPGRDSQSSRGRAPSRPLLEPPRSNSASRTLNQDTN